MNEPIERITYNGEIFVIIIRAKLPREGFNFVSRDEDELQVGVNHYNETQIVKPHYHLECARSTKSTSEVLHIDSGACHLTIYDPNNQAFAERDLVEGDTVVFIKGGHGLTFSEKTRIIEVKQGPYFGPGTDKKLI